MENELGSIEGVVSVMDTVSVNTVGCSALPSLTADSASGLSAWALRAVPHNGLARISYAVVSIRVADSKRRSGAFARR